MEVANRWFHRGTTSSGCCVNSALLFSSGLAATTVITNLLNAGDHIVSMDDVYGG